MHSKNFRIGFVVLSLVAIMAAPSVLFADGDPKGNKEMNDRVIAIENDLNSLQAQIDTIKADKSIQTDGERDARIAPIQAQMDAERKEMKKLQRKLTAATRKYLKIVRDESRGNNNVEKLTKERDDAIAKLKEGVEKKTLSEDEITELQKLIKDDGDEITRLQNRVGRKENQIKGKLNGEEAPDRCRKDGEGFDVKTRQCRKCEAYEDRVTQVIHYKGKDQKLEGVFNCQMKPACDEKDQARDPKDDYKCRACTKVEVVNATSNTCEPKVCLDKDGKTDETKVVDATSGECVAKAKEPDEKQMRGVAACWDNDNPKTVEIYSLYDLGAKDLKLRGAADQDVGGTTTDKALTEYFEGQVAQVADALKPNGRVMGLDVVTYNSKVEYTSDKNTKSRRQKEIATANERSKNAVNNLYGQLFARSNLASDWVKPVGLDDYSENVETPDPKKVSVGAKWTAGEVKTLKKKEHPDAKAVLAAAAAIVDSKDDSPMKVTTGKDRAENIKLTMAKIYACKACMENAAALKFLPYQYTKMTVKISKFDSKRPGCYDGAKKIANQVDSKNDGGDDVVYGKPEKRGPAKVGEKHMDDGV